MRSRAIGVTDYANDTTLDPNRFTLCKPCDPATAEADPMIAGRGQRRRSALRASTARKITMDSTTGGIHDQIASGREPNRSFMNGTYV